MGRLFARLTRARDLRRLMVKWGFTRPRHVVLSLKKSLRAAEQDRTEVAEARLERRTALANMNRNAWSMIKSVARECAEHGVTAYCLAPGLLATQMAGMSYSASQNDAIWASIPANRLGSALDVAAAAAFLASDEAGYITGQTLRINGGLGNSIYVSSPTAVRPRRARPIYTSVDVAGESERSERGSHRPRRVQESHAQRDQRHGSKSRLAEWVYETENVDCSLDLRDYRQHG